MFNCNGRHTREQNVNVGSATIALMQSKQKDYTITDEPVIKTISEAELSEIGEWMSQLAVDQLTELANMRVD